MDTKKVKLITAIAHHCEWHKTVNQKYIDICGDNIIRLQNELPHGSGIDSGCNIDVHKSGKRKVIIQFEYHLMDENGMYTGWEPFELHVIPTLGLGWLELKFVKGRNINQIKDYLYDTFFEALEKGVELTIIN